MSVSLHKCSFEDHHCDRHEPMMFVDIRNESNERVGSLLYGDTQIVELLDVFDTHNMIMSNAHQMMLSDVTSDKTVIITLTRSTLFRKYFD